MAQTYKKTSWIQLTGYFVFSFAFTLHASCFVRSGGSYLDNGSVGGPHASNMGNNGQYWSLRASSETANTYNLNFNASSVNPASLDRWRGYSLRWLIPRWGADLLALHKKKAYCCTNTGTHMPPML